MKVAIIVAAGCLIARENNERRKEFLLVQEKSSPFTGKWNLPVGRLEEKENIVACAKREVLEETNLKVEPCFLLGVYQQLMSIGNIIAFVFEANIIEGEIKTPEDLMNVEWFEFNAIQKLSLVSEYIMNAIEKWTYKEFAKIPIKKIINIEG